MADSGVIQREEEEQKGVMERRREKMERGGREVDGRRLGAPSSRRAGQRKWPVTGSRRAVQRPLLISRGSNDGRLNVAGSPLPLRPSVAPPLQLRRRDIGHWKEPEPEPTEATLGDTAALVNTWRGGIATGSPAAQQRLTNLPTVSFISRSCQNGGGEPDAIKHLH